VGDIGVREITWPTDEEVSATAAGTAVAEDVRAWLGEIRGLRAVA
jgi:hypothetical protein